MLTDLSIQSTRDRMLLLRSLPAFAPLEDAALSLLAEHVRVRVCRDGERLSSLGEPVRNAYVVLEGKVRWRRDARAETFSERHGVVGWVTMMARDPNGLEAHASGHAVVLELAAEVLEQALEDDFAIVRNSMRLGAHALLGARGNLPAPPDKLPAFDMGVLRSQRRTLVERLIAMRQVPLFARANAEAMIALVRSSEEVRFEPGQVLWQLGEPATFWILNEYGRIRCTNAAGQTQDIGAGFALGIMDSLAQEPRVYEARADTLVIANRLEVESFMGIMEAYFELARDYLAFLSRTVLEVQADARERAAE